ncbi:MAG: hypothetical protein WC413_04395 [Candidatus Nanoarchaeia archaeon]
MVKEVKTLLTILLFAVLGLFLFDILSSFNSNNNVRVLEGAICPYTTCPTTSWSTCSGGKQYCTVTGCSSLTRACTTSTTVTEKVTCNFLGAVNAKICKGTDASNIQLAKCTIPSKTSCSTSISGRKGAAITWKVDQYTYTNAKGQKYSETCVPSTSKYLDGSAKIISFACKNVLLSGTGTGTSGVCPTYICSRTCPADSTHNCPYCC